MSNAANTPRQPNILPGHAIRERLCREARKAEKAHRKVYLAWRSLGSPSHLASAVDRCKTDLDNVRAQQVAEGFADGEWTDLHLEY